MANNNYHQADLRMECPYSQVELPIDREPIEGYVYFGFVNGHTESKEHRQRELVGIDALSASSSAKTSTDI